MNFSNVKDWMKSYNVRELFLWLQTTAVHPANQLFQARFELLLGLLFSIPPEKFNGKNLTRAEFENFIQAFEKKFSQHFLMIEDWKPFGQLKLIPYFFDKRKYYFFYGALERPYEFLRQFENLYLIANDEETYSEFVLIKQLFTLSIEFQSQVIKKLSQSDEAKIDSEQIYVPTQQFFDDISPLFQISPQQLYGLESLSVLDPGVFTHIGGEKIFEACIDHELFKTFYVCLSNNNNYLLIPQLQLEILYDIANIIIKSSPKEEQLKSLVFKNFISRLRKKCLQFFTVRRLLIQILQKDTNQNLAESADIIVRIDTNKIFLLKAAKHSFEIDSSKQVENALNELQKAIEAIKKEEVIGLHYFNNQVSTVPVKEIEFWAVVVFENTTLNYKIKLPRDINSNNIWTVNMMDLQGIFEFLPSCMSLIKFLKNDRELLNKSQVVSADYLDRFAYYISNGESYSRAGISPHMLAFASHSWHDFYHEKLFEKYQDNVYELIEYEFPDTFNRVKQHSDNIYAVIDTGWLNGGLVVKYGEHLIWVMYPTNGFSSPEEEIKAYSGLIGPLYADYLNRLRDPLIKFFKKYNFHFQTKYYIAIYPASYVKRTKKLHFLKSYVSQLSKEHPLIVVTRRTSGFWNIRSCVIYDYQYLVDLFAPQENVGERFCFNQLIKSLIRFFDKKASEGEVNCMAEEFINKNIPLGIKGYSQEIFIIDNPKLDDYGRHEDLSKADIAKVSHEIAEFLAKNGEKPGEYHGAEVKRLNNLIFEFLQKKLENEIKRYNKSLLFYAYKEVELIEGRREASRIQLSMDASKYTEYDVVQRNIETTLEISCVANSAKYIIETVLKIGADGANTINDEAWHYLQAIAVVLHETTIISDYIHHDIVPHTLKISDLFEIEILRGQEVFDQKKFYRVKSEQEVGSAKQTFAKRKEILGRKQAEVSGDVQPFPYLLQGANKAFKSQFGFFFDNFVTVLFALGRMNLFHRTHFPLSLISEQDLISKLRENIRYSLDETEMKKILNFASLNFSTYTPDEELIPTKLLRRKERLNLCPLVYLDSGEYLYGNQACLGAVHIWFNSISSADFPCALEENSPIDKALADLHQHLDKELEKKVEEVAKPVLGQDNVESTIDNFKRLSPSFPAKPDCGEIDLLAVNKSLKRIYILDAKNLNRRIRPYDIRQEMKKFFEGKKSYLTKLTKKEKFIQTNLKEILKHFSIQDDRGWQVSKAFVVNTNYPSAYSPEKSVNFVLLDNLVAYLRGIET